MATDVVGAAVGKVPLVVVVVPIPEMIETEPKSSFVGVVAAVNEAEIGPVTTKGASNERCSRA